MEETRLQKYMAECGIASRRKCEQYISDGLVKVNGVTVTELGTKVIPGSDRVLYRGCEITPSSDKIYIMLNKPAGCVCTCSDEKGRKTILDCISGIDKRIYPVGRLDFTSEGLLILTNDGTAANKLTHPVNRIEKKYLAVIDSSITDDEIKKLESGVTVDGYRTSKAIFHIMTLSEKRSEILCVICEGRNRQIRKMFETVGKNVVYLKRVAVGELQLGNLKKGAFRYLTADEIKYIKGL